ncbi:hypothetical protein OHT59_11315 [Streptomyces sp. NBC_00243]|uniref:hypothetical protein n=1 Tax=Streptomyces sp. NBC_00243 TaxID=2975688 RepID=UPI002DDB3B31|nr:hypothetical protein [Streptomyces sp. NBC_00243]WRZ19026.1 hypothetical protein OHT59_11315 [Streptomyces sp. NBC_00243]
MTRVVLVHGIAQQYKGAHTLLADWFPALSDGIALAGARPAREDVSMAFYGDLFRPAGHRGLGVPELEAADVEEGLERDLLLRWWEAAAREESQVAGPDAAARLRTPDVVQRALNALSHSSFFAGLSERLMIYSARQVRRYFTELQLRALIQERLVQALSAQTEVVVAHSLGSVIAYEVLCAQPELQDLTLVTLGSPLAVRGLVFDRLVPEPTAGHGRWPAPVKRWANIADRGDVVALAKELAPSFGDRVTDVLVHNGARAHDVRPYLTARETGQAVVDGLGTSGAG